MFFSVEIRDNMYLMSHSLGSSLGRLANQFSMEEVSVDPNGVAKLLNRLNVTGLD